MSHNETPKGGEFLLIPGDVEHCFVPEDFSDEHRMIFKTSMDFRPGRDLAQRREDREKGR
jgi:hypothetical protein